MLPGAKPYLAAPLFGIPMGELTKWALATPALYYVGWRFHRGAWAALRRGAANMDVLVVLGTNASYIYSVLSVLHHHTSRHHRLGKDYTATDFFETCAMIISFICFGKYLECAAKGRTSEAIGQLLRLAPESATLVTLDDQQRVLTQEQVGRRWGIAVTKPAQGAGCIAGSAGCTDACEQQQHFATTSRSTTYLTLADRTIASSLPHVVAKYLSIASLHS